MQACGISDLKEFSFERLLNEELNITTMDQFYFDLIVARLTFPNTSNKNVFIMEYHNILNNNICIICLQKQQSYYNNKEDFYYAFLNEIRLVVEFDYTTNNWRMNKFNKLLDII